MKVFIQLVLFAYLSQSIESKLRLLSVVFRHGDRIPDIRGFEAYPNDPYKNRTFFPVGGGGLTNQGKNREHRLGQFLRRQYDDFLGPYYYPGELDGRSTFIERTKMSLQLVLNGLYPPKRVQEWNKYIHWQPLPVRFVNHLDDVLMFPQECPKFLQRLSHVTISPEYQAKLDTFDSLMYNLSVATGETIDNPVDMYFLYGSLMALTSMNLELPEWSQDVFPRGGLYDGYVFEFDYTSFNDELTRLNGGMLLRKITDDMTAACSGKLDRKRKLFLYSGHEFSVAAILKAMNVYKTHDPRFSSAAVIELHKENHKCIVKVKHYKGIVDKLTPGPIYEELKVPGCNTGYLREFKNVLQNHIATDEDVRSCDKRLVPDLLKKYRNLPKGITDAIVQDVIAEKAEKGRLT